MTSKRFAGMWVLALAGAAALGMVCGRAQAQFDSPVEKKWTVQEKDDKGEMKEVTYMTLDRVMVHEEDPAKAPQPRVVTPGTASTPEQPGTPPSDAIVLFDGKDLSGWTDMEGRKTKWVVDNGAMTPVKDAKDIRTKGEYGSCQLHVEWMAPAKVEGEGQGRGNSGIFLMGQYELQVLDSFENPVYPDGQAGAFYGRKPPLVNACRKPGEWQTYDVVFHRPVFDENGQVVKRATFTVFHNGVLIQDHYALSGGTGWLGPHAVTDYVAHGDKGPIQLQDHGNPIRYRNIWLRELAD